MDARMIGSKIRDCKSIESEGVWNWRIQWQGRRSGKLFHGTKILRKRGPGAPRPRTTGRAGAMGKGREGVILSILDTWNLRRGIYTP